MAGREYLNQLSAVIRTNALGTLHDLLPEDDGSEAGREVEVLVAAQRDVTARSDGSFQVNALVAALTKIVAAQQQEIDRLGRVKANAATLSSKADKE